MTVATADDSLYEGDEDYTATLSAAGGSGAGYTVSSSGDTATGAITDNDAPSLSLKGLSSATEGEEIELTVTSDVAVAATAPAIGFTLTFASRGDRGVEGADFGGDYSDLTQPLPAVAFSGDGGTTATVSVATVDDNFYEGSEGYTVGLSAPTGDA
ncbi:MAG: Calx-beta domain-containing protein, partial [Candidatus Eutrophobiaceae bacterium]